MNDHPLPVGSDRAGRRWLRSVLLALSLLMLLLVAWELFLEVKWNAGPFPADITPALKEQLRAEGLKALAGGDVPVGAVVIYGDSVIGAGCNTVIARGEAGGHAEINALSDAMKRIGVRRFDALNRDSLVLVSTFEPCLMCTGALMEAKVRHVRFLKPKPLLYRLREDARQFLATIRMERREPSELQDSLFLNAASQRR
jgi:tRNA(Arg) A34 adenosine deaminase TadA